MSCANALRPFLASVVRGSRAAASVANPASHAPHGSSTAAGPSRCFCTSARQAKASELPLDYSLHDVQEEFASDHTSPSFWPAPTFSQRSNSSQHPSPLRDADLPIYPDQPFPQPKFPPISPSRPLPSNQDDFFTSTVPDYEPCDVKGKRKHIQYPSLYIDTLDSKAKTAFLHSTRILIGSGERSMQALLSVMTGDDLSDERCEQLACLVLSDCIRQQQNASVVWDLYLSWLRASSAVYSASPGPTRAPMCNLQAKTIYKCCVYLQSAGLVRQAAAMAADVRLKPSQARFLTRRLSIDRQLTETLKSRFEIPSSPLAVRLPTLKWLKARFTLHELANTTCTLLLRGTTIEREPLSHMLTMLCLTSSHAHVVRLFRSAQRRIQLNMMGVSSSGRGDEDIGEFWRKRTNEPPTPAILDTPALEKVVRLLCAQKKAGAEAAYKIVKSLPMEQRTKAMYDSLMKVYGHAPLDGAALEQQSLGRSSQVGHQILQELTTVPHLGGVTIETVSSRIISHAAARRWDAVRSDLRFLRTSPLDATIHDLHHHAKHAILRCGIETGHLQFTFGIAAKLIARSQASVPSRPENSRAMVTPASVVHTLLLSAQVMRTSTVSAESSSRGGQASRTRLLMRFLSHYSQLHLTFPILAPPTWETLTLFVRLLAVHERSIDTATLWKLVRVICDRFAPDDQRIVPLLLAFARVFQQRHDAQFCAQIQTLIVRTTTAAHTTTVQ